MSVKFSPWGNSQFFDINGDPAVGWRIYSYAAGSSTLQSTYTTEAGTVPQSNPIILDAIGKPTTGKIWLTAGLAYKFVLTDENGVIKDTPDNISGVNDSSNTTSQWQASGVGPIYINATSFTLVGDQTSEFHVGRRLQFTTTAGTVYGTIAASAYTSLTTVTMTMEVTQALDAGLSAVNLSILRADTSALPKTTYNVALINESVGANIASAATINLDTATGNVVEVTGTTAITAITLAAGAERTVRFTGSLTLTHNAVITLPGGASITTVAGDIAIFRGWASGIVRCVAYTRADGYPLAGGYVPVRQTVLSGPVDSSGFSAFVGATGSATVTATGTLKATAAAGGDANYTGSIANPSWTGLSTNGTMYLYLDITSAGVVTTGSTALAPNYQWGGTYSTTSGQNTFNIQEMTMKAGNGSVATQVYRVFVGEVTVAGAVVTAITWYALMGAYSAAWTATLPGTAVAVARAHNIGTDVVDLRVEAQCTTADLSYSTGDILIDISQTNSAPIGLWRTPLSAGFIVSSAGGLAVQNKSTGAFSALTTSSWKYRIVAKRRF